MKHLILSLIVVSSALVTLPQLIAQDANGVYTKVDTPPSPTKTVAPEFPEDMREKNVEGLVAIVCVIDESGSVISTAVSKSSSPEFNKPAMEAAAKWKFKPAKVAGKAVKVKVTIPIRFSYTD